MVWQPDIRLNGIPRYFEANLCAISLREIINKSQVGAWQVRKPRYMMKNRERARAGFREECLGSLSKIGRKKFSDFRQSSQGWAGQSGSKFCVRHQVKIWSSVKNSLQTVRYKKGEFVEHFFLQENVNPYWTHYSAAHVSVFFSSECSWLVPDYPWWCTLKCPLYTF